MRIALIYTVSARKVISKSLPLNRDNKYICISYIFVFHFHFANDIQFTNKE